MDVARHLRPADRNHEPGGVRGEIDGIDPGRQIGRCQRRAAFEIAAVQYRITALVRGPDEIAAVAREREIVDIVLRCLDERELARGKVVMGERLELAILIGDEIKAGAVRGPREIAVEGRDLGREQGLEIPRLDIEEVQVVAVLAAGLADQHMAAAGLPGAREIAEMPLMHEARLTACGIRDIDVEIAPVALRRGIDEAAAVLIEIAEGTEGPCIVEHLPLVPAIGTDHPVGLALIALAVGGIEQPRAVGKPAIESDGGAEGELLRPATGGIDDP